MSFIKSGGMLLPMNSRLNISYFMIQVSRSQQLLRE